MNPSADSTNWLLSFVWNLVVTGFWLVVAVVFFYCLFGIKHSLEAALRELRIINSKLPEVAPKQKAEKLPDKPHPPLPKTPSYEQGYEHLE